MILSFRHLDALYKIDRKSGEIVWKLGGTPTAESLEILGDPDVSSTLGGPHDARVLPNGTITVHDNRTGFGEPPRALRFRIDEGAGTAKLVEEVTDPKIEGSFCCGSARKLSGGNWLVGWGGTNSVGAYDDAGRRVFELELAGGAPHYRANWVERGDLSARDLRRAMDKMAARRRGSATAVRTTTPPGP